MMMCIFLFRVLALTGNAQQGTGSLGDFLIMILGEECSSWSMQTGPEHCNPPAAAKPALGLGPHLQHAHSACATEGVPLHKPKLHEGRDHLSGDTWKMVSEL